MMSINAMAGRPTHPVGTRGHGVLDLQHLPCRIPRKLAILFRSQLDQCRRRHDSGKGILETLHIVDVAMQRPRHIVPIEHALLTSDNRQYLLRPLPDQLGVAPRRLLIDPCP